MPSIKIRFAIAGGLLLSSWSAALAVEVHTLRSGNGVLGGPDALITTLHGPQNNEFGLPLTPAQFAAASSGPPAIILSQVLNGTWVNPLPVDPNALWISEDNWGAWDGASNLYAINFNVVTPIPTSASLDFHFACDNWLGDSVNEGLFVNGVPLMGSSGGNYGVQTSLMGLNLTGVINPGPNTLHILSTDVGASGGLVFSATITINGDGTVAAEEQTADFQLGAAYPNPFNPTTTLSFSMAETGTATLEVFNLSGRNVATLWSGMAERGTHEVRFDAGALPSGLYLYRLSTAQGMETRKLILCR